jgi:hypothetical protein
MSHEVEALQSALAKIETAAAALSPLMESDDTTLAKRRPYFWINIIATVVTSRRFATTSNALSASVMRGDSGSITHLHQRRLTHDVNDTTGRDAWR